MPESPTLSLRPLRWLFLDLNNGRVDRVGTKIAFGRIPDLHEFHE